MRKVTFLLALAAAVVAPGDCRRGTARVDLHLLHRPDVPADGADKSNGSIFGFDVDMANAIAANWGTWRRR